MTDEDVERLMQFDGIVKNRLKIKSTITNARLFLAYKRSSVVSMIIHCRFFLTGSRLSMLFGH